jgi:hypothetical protein
MPPARGNKRKRRVPQVRILNLGLGCSALALTSTPQKQKGRMAGPISADMFLGCRTLALFKGAGFDFSRFSISLAAIVLREKQKGRMEHPAFPFNRLNWLRG